MFQEYDAVRAPRDANGGRLTSVDKRGLTKQTILEHFNFCCIVALTSSATALTWRALGDLGRALCSHGAFAELAAVLRAEVRPAERLRELYPLPLIPIDAVGKLYDVGREDSREAKSYFDGVVVGLNWMYGYRGSCISIGKATAAQDAAHGVIAKAGLDLHARLVASFESRDNRGWRVFEEKGAAP